MQTCIHPQTFCMSAYTKMGSQSCNTNYSKSTKCHLKDIVTVPSGLLELGSWA